jgi:DNA-binding SARP family transcriptional activator
MTYAIGTSRVFDAIISHNDAIVFRARWRYLGVLLGSEVSTTRIQLCGRFVVRLHGERIEQRMPGRQGRLLFAYIAARQQRAASRDELMEAIWSEGVPSAPEMALSALLSKLRRLLGEDMLQGRDEIRLDLPADAFVDVETARSAIHMAESLIEAGRWGEASAHVFAARYISERPFMRGEQSPWIEGTRRELDEVFTRALECRVSVGLELGGHENTLGVACGRRLVEIAPYRESGYRLLMQALQREGNSAEALRVYEQLRTRLRDELGVTPSTDVQRLHAELLRDTAG